MLEILRYWEGTVKVLGSQMTSNIAFVKPTLKSWIYIKL